VASITPARELWKRLRSVYNLVIFGERPGPNTDPNRPLFPHTTTGAAAKLIEMLGISREEYLKLTRYNVVNNHHASTNHPGVRSRVEYLLSAHRRESLTRFLFLGRSAAQALPRAYRNLPFGVPHGSIMIIPHPSGRNRYYNSQVNKSFIVQSLRKFAGIS
jgi:hypothetical protein